MIASYQLIAVLFVSSVRRREFNNFFCYSHFSLRFYLLQYGETSKGHQSCCYCWCFEASRSCHKWIEVWLVSSSPSANPQWRLSLLRKLWCQYCELLLRPSCMVTSIDLLSSVIYSSSLPFRVSHRFQRIRKFNNAELHPYISQYNPIQKVSIDCALCWCDALYFAGGWVVTAYGQ